MERYSFFIAFSFFLLFACQQEEVVEEYSHEIYTCPNEEWLFSVADSVPAFSIDYNLEEDSLKRFVSQKLKGENCIYSKQFGLKLANGDQVPILSSISCEGNLPPLCGYLNTIEILINKHNQLLLESDYVIIDSINTSINSMLKEESSYSLRYISISLLWDEETNSDTIENVLKEVQQSIIDSYQSLSRSHFSKNLCFLNRTQIEVLKEMLNIHIELKNVNNYPQIPPPPKIE